MTVLADLLRNAQGWSHEASMPLADMADSIERALVAAAGIDAKHSGASCRFREYIGPLRQAGAFQYPRSTLWDPGSRELKLFIEGSSQAWGLWKATRLWPGLPDDVAREKLGIVLDGCALPEDAQNDAEREQTRSARDFLVEFSTAYLLRTGGFGITMTARDEDVLAYADGLPPLVIECTRPESVKSLRRRVRKLFEKLADARRCDGGARVGMIVVNIDRLLDRVPCAVPDLAGIPSFETIARAHEWADTVLLVALGFLSYDTGCSPCPEVPLVLAHLSVPVFAKDEGAFRMIDKHTYNVEARKISDVTERLVRRLGQPPPYATVTI